MISDLRFAIRSLWKTPGFTLVAVLTIALGVGGNTAIFSVINAVLLNPFPYVDSDRLLFIGSTRNGPENGMPVTYPDFRDWQARNKSFRDLAFSQERHMTLTGTAEPSVLKAAAVSASVWPLLGIQPELGRIFSAGEDKPGADPVCVLSHATWKGRFNGDPQIVGVTVTLDGTIYTVAGVMPAAFKFWASDLWIPVGLEADTEIMRSRVLRMNAWVVGTPKVGISAKEAEAELNLIASQLALEHPESNKDTGVSSQLLSDAVTGRFQQPLFMLLGAVCFVLLIACANVANLLLARTAARQREYAIRMALGAPRWRLIRQMLLESLPLSVAGGALGILLGTWGLDALLLVLPADAVPVEAQIEVNVPVMLFTMTVVVGTMLLFSLFPAWEGSRSVGTEALQEGARGTSGTRTGRMRAALVIAEVMLSITLLVGAGLLIRSMSKLHGVDPGFDPKGLLVVPMQLPEARYPSGKQATTFYSELVERVRVLPGVKAAGATTNAPFFNGMDMPLLVEGRTYTDLNQLQGVQFSGVVGDYFPAQGLRFIKGRAFDKHDRLGSEQVIILNEEAVKRFVPDGDPLGQRVMLGIPENLLASGLLPPAIADFKWATIVGVVNSSSHFALQQQEPIPEAYVPAEQLWDFALLRASMALLLRVEGDNGPVTAGIRAELERLDPNQPVGRIVAMPSAISQSLQGPRFITILLGVFAALALALAVVGIYGSVAWNVTQRTKEIGIRQALGASRPDVLRLVVLQGMRAVLLGLVFGLAGSVALARTMQSLLFGISAFDPWTFALVAATLGIVALAACVVPARRATRVDPMVALRAE